MQPQSHSVNFDANLGGVLLIVNRFEKFADYGMSFFPRSL